MKDKLFQYTKQIRNGKIKQIYKFNNNKKERYTATFSAKNFGDRYVG